MTSHTLPKPFQIQIENPNPRLQGHSWPGTRSDKTLALPQRGSDYPHPRKGQDVSQMAQQVKCMRALWTATPPGSSVCGIFLRQEYWSVLPFLSPGDLPDTEIEPTFPALAGRFFTTEPPGKCLAGSSSFEAAHPARTCLQEHVIASQQCLPLPPCPAYCAKHYGTVLEVTDSNWGNVAF